MIYVLTYPETVWERLKFHIRGTVPTVLCGEIRQGTGVVECVTGEDSCITIPMNRVMQITWASGYKNAFEQAQKEYFDGLARSMAGMAVAPSGCTCSEDEDDCDCATGPYIASSAAVDGYN